MVPIWHGITSSLNSLICWGYLLDTTAKRQYPDRVGREIATPFRSLRLSVRTPPFHGGESGSIPLGSANNFNGLAPTI
jgi:hypothetical protein